MRTIFNCTQHNATQEQSDSGVTKPNIMKFELSFEHLQDDSLITINIPANEYSGNESFLPTLKSCVPEANITKHGVCFTLKVSGDSYPEQYEKINTFIKGIAKFSGINC